MPFEKRIIVFSALLLTATWCMCYMVGISGLLVKKTLSDSEEIINSLIHALQSFSMDENYAEYILNGSKLIFALYPVVSKMPMFYSEYLSVLNGACPIACGSHLVYHFCKRDFEN